MDFNRLKIKEGLNWDIFLHEDQTAIGRLYFWYKDNNFDLLEISEEAMIEFYRLGQIVKNALQTSFEPDMFNYLALNNKTRHLHIHFIPRYATPRNFEGYTFIDQAFGSSYKRSQDFSIPEEVLMQIKYTIQKSMSPQNSPVG